MSEIFSSRLILRTVPRDVASALLAGQPTPGFSFAPGYPSEFSLEVMQMLTGDPEHQQQPGPGDLTPPFFIVRRADSLILGEIGYQWNAEDGSAQVGYTVVEPSWGQGYATEALQALTTHLLGHPEVRRVFADTFVDHIASRRVMEKAGLTYCGQHQAEDDGKLLDLVTYETLRPS